MDGSAKEKTGTISRMKNAAICKLILSQKSESGSFIISQDELAITTWSKDQSLEEKSKTSTIIENRTVMKRKRSKG